MVKADDSILQSTLETDEIVGIILKGAKIEHVRVIAGAGTSTTLRAADRRSRQHGGGILKWQKKTGIMQSKYFRYEVHWYELNRKQ